VKRKKERKVRMEMKWLGIYIKETRKKERKKIMKKWRENDVIYA